MAVHLKRNPGIEFKRAEGPEAGWPVSIAVGTLGLRVLGILALGAVALAGLTLSARGDEIRLKDGKKLYGVIVAYEDSMFKVKTDFGYVLVEKDKISSIIPSTPAAESKAESKKDAQPAKKEAPAKLNAAPEAATAVASSADASELAKEASVKPSSSATKSERAAPKLGNAAVRPALPANNVPVSATAPALKADAPNATAAVDGAAIASPAPKEPEVPANHEEVQGNLYTNFTHGFRMYKAPSWETLDDARSALPNAIVAMGTQDESTLLVIGQEKTKETLEPAARTVERRLHDVYENYRLISQKKTTASGLPAMEYRYRGVADGHDWSGTLVVMARGGETFTVLGMTYADTDLIQIQENVIARAIGSLNFDVK